MIECLTGKITKLLFSFVLLCVFLNSTTIVANAYANDLSIPEEYTSKMDDSLKNYIDENIPKDSAWLNSNMMTNFVQTSAHKSDKKIDISDKVNGTVYTFSSKDNGEPIYYTVLDCYFTQKMKASKNDLLEINVNDYLLPVSPGKGKLLTKNKKAQNWTEKKNAYVIVNGSFASVYGSQIRNNENFSRVILSFASYGNLESKENSPRYIVEYTHQKDSILPLIVFCAVIVFLFIFLFYYKYRKKQKI